MLIDVGVLEPAGRRADAAYGVHVFGGYFPHGLFTARPGTLMASSAILQVRDVGEGAHGSAPHKGRDPILVAAEMVVALQTIVFRRFDVFDPLVITVGSFHAGSKGNVIPDDAVFEATLRTFRPATADRVVSASIRLCEQIAAADGVPAEAPVGGDYPVTVNDPIEYAFAADTVRDLFGAHRFTELDDPLTESEDFSRVLAAVPGCYTFLGAGTLPPEQAASNHSPNATFDYGLLPDIAAYLAELAVRRFARGYLMMMRSTVIPP